MKNHNHQTGATALIEMLAAVALIGVLAYQAIPNTFETREAALNALVISQFNVVRDAIEMEFFEHGFDSNSADGYTGYSGTGAYATSTDEIKPYLPGGALLANPFDGSTNPVWQDDVGTTTAGLVYWKAKEGYYFLFGYNDAATQFITHQGGIVK